MRDLLYPLKSLKEGHWFKLICGASYQHLPAVRNLTLAYTLAGADCIDVAADPAVIAAAKEAIEKAGELAELAKERGYGICRRPWLMVSLNDGEDPHFRKAELNPTACPRDCPRPCESICPASAIVFGGRGDGFSGVIEQRCYGCGRCVPVCPIKQVVTRSYVCTPAVVAPVILAEGADAIEIHTQVGHLEDFKRLWGALAPQIDHLKLLAISCPDGKDLIEYLWALYELISPLPCPLIWQTDGRPMSGDIGDGTTRAAIKLGEKVLSAKLPGYVQIAGGTNGYTVAKLEACGLLNRARESGKREEFQLLSLSSYSPSYIAGIAYGSYARVLLAPVLERLELFASSRQQPCRLEEFPTLLWEAVRLAYSLVSQLKMPIELQQTT
ncbi:MAG: 4Fe-4S ferredoxin [Oscillatoriaceae bacterium SKW80]|nr:4Fe-4S ferredoxin [Oscillatoriaceae bacterium SKYG93]MCX8121227.1 4Fe-4S ferredoxin [Oscillatoriaceae bacterium SKW80]MDW8453439.1 LdpA C-terminal domain-containing domain [Oscillatoriaceae cyanobacterium SKYGB_i_bin93]HIK26794.1 4Fe-4S ferredoxin [Oscillatoriaceae cyanobacterium M7585_C2015_266]